MDVGIFAMELQLANCRKSNNYFFGAQQKQIVFLCYLLHGEKKSRTKHVAISLIEKHTSHNCGVHYERT